MYSIRVRLAMSTYSPTELLPIITGDESRSLRDGFKSVLKDINSAKLKLGRAEQTIRTLMGMQLPQSTTRDPCNRPASPASSDDDDTVDSARPRKLRRLDCALFATPEDPNDGETDRESS